MNDTISTGAIRPFISKEIHIPGRDTVFAAHLFLGEGDERSLSPVLESSERGIRVRHMLGESMYTLGATDILIPSPMAFNAKVVDPEELRPIPLETEKQVRAYRTVGTYADATWLPHYGYAYAFSGAGCPIVVIDCAGFFFVAHGGRDSVLDRVRVETLGENVGREHEGIVASIFAKLRPSEKALQRARIWVFWSIPQMAFPHDPKNMAYAAYNGNILPYATQRWGRVDANCVRLINGIVYPDIPRIIRAQCIELGVPAENINLEHAYLMRGVPHTRNSTGARYLAAIIRRS